MTNAQRQHSPRIHPHKIANFLMLVAVASAASLAGCQSALDYSGVDRGSAQYTDSLVARAVMQGNYHGDFGPEPTVAQGVRELPRVDSAGPTATADTAVQPMNTSATHPNDMEAAPPTTVPTQPTPAGNGPLPPQPLTTQPLGTSTPAANEIGLSAATLNAPEPVFNLSLQDAIARALKNALDIKVQSYNPGIKESIVIQKEADFDPVLFGSSQYTETNEPALGITENAQGREVLRYTQNVDNGQVLQNQIGLKKLLPSGGTAQVSAGDTWRNLPGFSGNGIGDPQGESWNPNLNATITQPLLRGFGVAITEANIYLAQRDRRISLETFRRQVITTVANVEEAYHNLILARTNVDIGEQLLAAAEDTYKRVNDRRAVDADQISVSQAMAAVEQRRAELVRERINLREQSDKLKSLLNDPEIDISKNALINPTDKPIAEPVVFNTADAIETALRQRTELQEDRLKLEEADINLTIARNDLLPQLDFTGSVQSNGLSKDFENSFGATVNGSYLDFAAGIKLQFPLGNRFAEAEVRQRQLERNQLMTQTVLDAQTVVSDVKQQLHELLGSYQEVEARERARIAAAEELKAITQKEQIVALTPEFLQLKLDAQNLLGTSEQSEIQAIVNYNLALMRLEQAKGTLLEFDRISLDRAPIYRPDDDYNRIRFLGKTFRLTD